jgi:plasmid stabilization system protein ParE
LDRETIANYFGQYNWLAAVRAGDRIEECVDLLEDFPLMGPRGRLAGTWELVVPQCQCVVVYRIHDNLVQILRVIHGGQEWPEQL